MYTANGEKITNEDSPLRNSDLVQLVGFTTYNSTLADDGYELLSSRKCMYCLYPHSLEQLQWSLRLEDDMYGIHTHS